MTRQENARKLAQAKKEKTREKIITLLSKNKENYIKKNGEYNISKISKDLSISRQIVRKHIQALIQEGII